ncbi:hypothetical protein V2J09_008722 [Rumex salicifolius]
MGIESANAFEREKSDTVKSPPPSIIFNTEESLWPPISPFGGSGHAWRKGGRRFRRARFSITALLDASAGLNGEGEVGMEESYGKAIPRFASGFAGRSSNFGKCIEQAWLISKNKRIISGHSYSLVFKAVAKARGSDEAIKMFMDTVRESDHEKDFDVVVYNTIISVCKNTINGLQVAIKIIDKIMVVQNNLIYQVQREIRTMKLLNHPNIVRIHEVLASKTKIYISYAKKLSEKEARKLFQQLIDAVEYCHCKGVYHRDLKPQNLLLDSKGNLKISDFGLSALQKPGSLLSTACGSPSYVAPELIRNRGYDGSGADIWAFGVILFEMLAGYLSFNGQSLTTFIQEANYKCPEEFTKGQRKLLSGIFKRYPEKRITIPEITEEKWFQTNYEPTLAEEFVERFDSNDDLAKFDSVEVAKVSTKTTTDRILALRFQNMPTGYRPVRIDCKDPDRCNTWMRCDILYLAFN